MKKISALALLLVSLSMPVFASPRNDDSPGRGVNPVNRVVHLVKLWLSSVLDDSWSIGTPKP